MTKIREHLSVNLRRMLKERRIKQRDLASLIGVTGEAVSQWISGKNSPQLDTLGKVADALDVPADELLKDPTAGFVPVHKSDLDHILIELAKVRGYRLVKANTVSRP